MNLEKIEKKINKHYNRELLQYFFGFSYDMKFTREEVETEIKEKGLGCSATYYVKELTTGIFKFQIIEAFLKQLQPEDNYIIIKIFGNMEKFKIFIVDYITVDYRLDLYTKDYHARFTIKEGIDIPHTIGMTVEDFIQQETIKENINNF